MGNWATLYTLESAKPRIRDDERHAKFKAVAKYHLPIAWLALYSPDDLHMVEIDPEEHHEESFLIAPTVAAVERLRSREETLLRTFSPHLGDAKAWLDDFIDALTSDGQPFVHLETDDLGSMVMDSQEWAAELRIMLAALDEGPFRDRSSWERFFGRKTSPGWVRYFHYFPLSNKNSQTVGAAYFVGEGY